MRLPARLNQQLMLFDPSSVVDKAIYMATLSPAWATRPPSFDPPSAVNKAIFTWQLFPRCG